MLLFIIIIHLAKVGTFEDFLGLAVVAVVVKSTTRCVPLFQATVEATRALDDNQD